MPKVEEVVKKPEIDTSKMLFEKEQILDHLQQKLETDRTRNQQFNPAQHPVK